MGHVRRSVLQTFVRLLGGLALGLTGCARHAARWNLRWCTMLGFVLRVRHHAKSKAGWFGVCWVVDDGQRRQVVGVLCVAPLPVLRSMHPSTTNNAAFVVRITCHGTHARAHARTHARRASTGDRPRMAERGASTARKVLRHASTRTVGPFIFVLPCPWPSLFVCPCACACACVFVCFCSTMITCDRFYSRA